MHSEPAPFFLKYEINREQLEKVFGEERADKILRLIDLPTFRDLKVIIEQDKRELKVVAEEFNIEFEDFDLDHYQSYMTVLRKTKREIYYRIPFRIRSKRRVEA